MLAAATAPDTFADGSSRDHIWEFGGGLSSASGASKFFDGKTAQSLSGGTTLYLGIAPCIYHSWFRFYLGGQTRMSMFSGASIFSISPYTELGFWRLYFGAGYTPFVYQNAAGSYTRHPGTSATFFQGGLILPITPEISLNLVASYETASVPSGAAGSASVTSPTSLMTYGLGFRLYFGGGPAFGSGSGGGGKFRGYRYPMGFGKF